MAAKTLEIVSQGSERPQDDETPLTRLLFRVAQLEADMIVLKAGTKMVLEDCATHAQAGASSLNRTRQIEVRIREALAALVG